MLKQALRQEKGDKERLELELEQAKKNIDSLKAVISEKVNSNYIQIFESLIQDFK